MEDPLLRLDPKESALIMVDMQNDFCHLEGFFARNGERMNSIGLEPELVTARIGTMRQLLETAREAGLFIVHTQIIHEPDAFNRVQSVHKIVPRTYRAYEGAPGEPPLAPGSWGAATHHELAPLPGEYVLVKRVASSFYQTDLEMVLRRRGIRTVIIAGTIAYACVLHTAFDAKARDLDVILASDGVASWAPELQEPTLRLVDLIIGAAVPTSELAELLTGSKVAG